MSPISGTEVPLAKTWQIYLQLAGHERVLLSHVSGFAGKVLLSCSLEVLMVAGQCQGMSLSPSETNRMLSWVFLHSSSPNDLLFSHLISTGEFIPRWLQPICPLLKWREPPASGTAPPVHEAWLLQYLLVEELYSKTRRKNKNKKKRENTFLYLTMFFEYVFFFPLNFCL